MSFQWEWGSLVGHKAFWNWDSPKPEALVLLFIEMPGENRGNRKNQQMIKQKERRGIQRRASAATSEYLCSSQCAQKKAWHERGVRQIWVIFTKATNVKRSFSYRLLRCSISSKSNRICDLKSVPVLCVHASQTSHVTQVQDSARYSSLRSRLQGMFQPRGAHTPQPLSEGVCQSSGEECIPTCQVKMSLSGL